MSDPIVDLSQGLFNDAKIQRLLDRLGVRESQVDDFVVQKTVELDTAKNDIEVRTKELERVEEFIQTIDRWRDRRTNEDGKDILAGEVDQTILNERMRVALQLKAGLESLIKLAKKTVEDVTKQLNISRERQSKLVRFKKRLERMKVDIDFGS